MWPLPALSLLALLVLGPVLALPAAATPGLPVGRAPGGPAGIAPGVGELPSVVLVVTDDQRWDTLAWMPAVQRRLAPRGVTFSNAFVVNPLCCPSRASILTGRYSHTTGVYRQRPPHGRFDWFDDSSTLATWLDDAGYATGLFGKYLDGYQHAALTGYVPPGWDRWVAFVRSRYYGYKLTVDGTVRSFGKAPTDYATDLLAGEAVAFVRETRGPVFLYFAPPAPHWPSLPSPQDAGAHPGPLPPLAPSFDEADVSDKPAWVGALDRLGPNGAMELERFRRDQLTSLLAVDRAVDGILDALAETGRLASALVVLTSDNGLAWGEHRWTKKEAPYEESIRVPLVIRYEPLAAAGRTEPRMALNVDLAPTVADVVGVEAPGAEGRSLLPVLAGRDVPWRTDFLVEHLEGANPVPTYCAVRTERVKYVRYETGEEELYDLRADPHELENRATDPGMDPMLAALRARLDELCDPAPPGFRASPPGRAWVGLGLLVALLAVEGVRGWGRARAVSSRGFSVGSPGAG